jgi:hypothetical protein
MPVARLMVEGLSSLASVIRFSFPNAALALYFLAYAIIRFTAVGVEGTRYLRKGVYFFPDVMGSSQMEILVFGRAGFSRN